MKKSLCINTINFLSFSLFLLSHLLQSSFYSCTDNTTAHNTRERVLQYEKIDRKKMDGRTGEYLYNNHHLGQVVF